MARNNNYLKFMFHVIYLIFVSYIVDQISIRNVSIKKVDRFLADLKHILLWHKVHGIEDKGQLHMIKQRCRYINCYFTTNRTLFEDIRFFDAIVFNLQDVSKGNRDFPKVRSYNQRYIFAANDSADNYPVCNKAYDSFFNWTWTYRRDSTISYSFISIYTNFGDELGSNFPWIKGMRAPDASLKLQLAPKKNAVAAFLDQCTSRSKREEFIESLQNELQKYNLTVDVYGKCGPYKCMRKTITPCYFRLRTMYHFFLALEDSFAQDYITDAVIHAYKNNVVPVVYGMANYAHYLPPGSYIDAMKLSLTDTAYEIARAVKNHTIYFEYYRWKRYYTIKESPVLDACTLCGLMNSPNMMSHRMTYSYFRKWWNPEFQKRCADDSKLYNL